MRTAAIGLCLWLATVGQGALAQENEAQPPESGAEATPPGEEHAAPAKGAKGEAKGEGEKEGAPSAAAAGKSAQVTWQDIYVVARRSVLKRYRLELIPTYNVSLNNSLIRHHGVGGQINFYLSEALFIGLEGTFYEKQLSAPNGHSTYYEIGAEDRIAPSVNRYVWSAFLDFGYIPITGKFTLFNATVVHWEAWIAAGVGVFETKIIPRDPVDQGFTNLPVFAGLLPGFGVRVWLARWLAFDTYIKNYLFNDQLEPLGRDKVDANGNIVSRMTGAQAKSHAVGSFTDDLVFGLGFSVLLPPGFEYRTPR